MHATNRDRHEVAIHRHRTTPPSRTRRSLLRGSLAILGATLLPALDARADSPLPARTDGPSPWQRLSLVGIDGKPFGPDRLDGQVVLVVNVASFCSYTPQYADLQGLWERYRDRGLVVLGVPCNQFGGQEPGAGKEIRNFCRSRYGVDFPMLAKQDVNGAERSPLYRWLIHGTEPARDVSWNFEKFVVNRQGEVVARFGSHVVPSDDTITRTLEMALDGAL